MHLLGINERQGWIDPGSPGSSPTTAHTPHRDPRPTLQVRRNLLDAHLNAVP